MPGGITWPGIIICISTSRSATMAAPSPPPRWSSPENLAEPPGCRCAPRPGISPRAAARAWSTRCWIFPRCGKARAWRRHSRSAMASHCSDFGSAARTSPPARRGAAPCWMRAFRLAARAARGRSHRRGTFYVMIAAAPRRSGAAAGIGADVSNRAGPAHPAGSHLVCRAAPAGSGLLKPHHDTQETLRPGRYPRHRRDRCR